MPLINGRSKKAFTKNVETEMKAHPDQRKKDLAIAFSVQRKAKSKKMAAGGNTGDSHLSDYRMKHAHLTAEQHAAKSAEIRKSTEGMSDRYKQNMETLASYHDKEAGTKKMADGGKADRLRQGAQEARKYDSQKSEKGVNTPRFPYPHNKESMGESQAGYYG